MTGLETVREHYLAATREQAESVLGGARRQAREIVDAASAQAVARLEEARRDGVAAADLDTSRAWTASRRRARSLVLAARRRVLEELRAAAREAVRSDPRYPALLERLAVLAGGQLGPGALVERDLEGAGGVVASLGDRRVDYSLAALVDHGLERLGPRVEELWR